MCVPAWWAHRAGACGGVAELGKHPYLRSTGQYQRHFDAHVNFTTGRRRQAKLKVPGHAPHFNRRVLHEIAVRPPHEALHDELVGDENAEVVLREALHERSLPPSYWQHPIVQKSAVPVWPVAFYLDGMPTTKKDGVIAFVVCNILTRKRHLACVIRKSRLCRCGCRGWCSLWVVMNYIAWSLVAAGEGQFPAGGCEGMVWDDMSERASWAGTALRGVFACIQVKCDWLESATSLGFPSWSSDLFPCL